MVYISPTPKEAKLAKIAKDDLLKALDRAVSVSPITDVKTGRTVVSAAKRKRDLINALVAQMERDGHVSSDKAGG